MTRKEYLDGPRETSKERHREYYSQFVNKKVKEHVIKGIGLDDILSSTDEHFNDIRLSRWDNLFMINPNPYSPYAGTYQYVVTEGYQRPYGTLRKVSPSVHVFFCPREIAQKLKALGDVVSLSSLISITKEAAKQLKEENTKE